MPAFSAVGAYVAGTLLGLTGTALTVAGVGLSLGGALVASVVAAGVASVASRLINGGGGGGSGGTTQNQGTRVQLAPATENKVPVVYGTANTKGIVTDARISSDNQQMTYVLILSERTQTGTHTIGDIFWNDELLTFDTGSNSHKVVSSRDQNGLGTTSTNYAGLMEMRVYAGSATTATNQIFPATNQVSAISYIGESSSTYQLSGFVYAVVKITYSAEKSVTNLAQMTFQVQNNLSNPGNVLYDYLTSPRYGAGISASEIDTDSMTNLSLTTSLRSISNEIPLDQFNSDGSTSTQSRYIINGVLSTGETVKNNLEKVTQACASWLTYDFTQGKWKVVVNRALSSSELSSVVTYDDDSIIGEITVNATNLEDLYNAIEVEFPSREIRDQNDYYYAEIADTERNDLEPDNKLNLRYDLINNAIHAQRLGLIELNQSRADKTIQFRTTYKGLQTSAGDVIKIKNEVYGWTYDQDPVLYPDDGKYFRVTRVREVENEDGSLFAEITGLEYDAAVYGDETITDYQPNTASGIPTFGGPVSLPAPSAPVLSASNPTSNSPNFTISTTIGSASSTVDTIEWWYSSSAGGTYTYLTNEHGTFAAGSTVSDIIYSLGAGTWYFKARTLNGSAASDYSSASSSFSWSPQPGGVNNGSISTATFSSQVQIVNTTSGALKIPLVATTSGYQPVYADSELSYDAASNLLSAGGLALSTGTVVQKVVSSGGFPLNAQGTASIFTSVGASPSLLSTNYSGNLTPGVHIRGYGQNRVGGTASTAAAPNVIIEGSYGTNTAPTAYQGSVSLGGFIAMGYDGNNWPSDTGQAYNYMGFFTAEPMTSTGTTTLQAGSGFNLYTQPAWTRPGTNTTRQRWLFQNWTTASGGPSQANINIGSGVTNNAADWPTMTMVDGTTYTGYGRSNVGFVNSIINIVGVPQQDSAPDNATLTATNTLNFISGRRSGTSGRRNAISSGDTIGIINFNGQTASSSTTAGGQSVSITASAMENFSGSARGGQLSIRTVSSGTTTISNRMDINDRQIGYNADSHIFRDKSASFNALTITTATTTVVGALNAPGTYHCEVARSSNTATTTSTDVIVYWNKTNSDPFNWLTNFTQIKPTVSGYYLVQGQIHFVEGIGTGQINAQIRKNGSTFAIAQDLQPTTAGAGRTLNMVGVVQLNGSTDYIDLSTYSSSSNGQTITGTADGAWTKVTLTKLQ